MFISFETVHADWFFFSRGRRDRWERGRRGGGGYVKREGGKGPGGGGGAELWNSTHQSVPRGEGGLSGNGGIGLLYTPDAPADLTRVDLAGSVPHHTSKYLDVR